MQESDLLLDYAPRRQFVRFHQRSERFACIVTHRRAGKTVACIQDLQRGATSCESLRPRFAYLAPFLKQSKAVAWDYLRAAMAPLRQLGATVHESELRVDYPKGGQVRLQRMIPKSCRLFGKDHASRKDRERCEALSVRTIPTPCAASISTASCSTNTPTWTRVWSEIIRPALADWRA